MSAQELDLRDYFQIVKKRLWMIVSIVVVVCLLAGVYSLYIKNPVYEASTKIIVNQTQQVQTAASQLDLNQINTNIQLINTYKEIIKTPAILDVVAKNYPEFDTTAEELLKKVNVSSVNNTQVMTLVVRDNSYQRAAEIVNAISLVFKQEIPSLFNVQNVSILNEAKLNPPVAPGPVEPNVVMNMAIAFIVSLMIGLGIAFLLEYLDDTLKTEEDIEKYLGLPTIAMITRLGQEETKTTATQAQTLSRKAGELEHVSAAK
ncbi:MULTISPECIES: Wzz/FepE/Etk N-terminal domain-containing protein [unclassified Paenibacillus]|uniref:YveK family protein n=1 Tax=unclassified Paenibacillus TaxID=185978 RepID=UPI002406D17A|nr:MULTISPECIES: Wzz/FepE/Etk N-terminal domain-containing protein [unclassified Paenibacillus]MDF9844058.1 capsular polysaccharide biosynthesis protein [Paenibacillus sp. PastF-2]MDF9850663.1 capsular polysaccharide biosynthesis protein [Paenibacillus sp. PastM-2]MDF9857186.1 capsular polysaccharide biosynthesis protein [Paenibacillus sp. PastF-1]MDH6482513.1 capsular polysaccharide biosynthesis protein [Paenibacillus sp. PastH-2]MDH6509884.1 capsular polysaccharide biosynthesis protein [Paen